MKSEQIVQPDVERLVLQALEGRPGVTAWCYAAVPLPGPGRWLVAYHIQADARAGGKAAARGRAEDTAQVLAALDAVPWADGVVCSSEIIDGPFYLPDDDGQPRYVTRAEVRVRPHRTGEP